MPAGTKPGYAIGRDSGGLTDRERQILSLLASGRTQKQIATEVHLSKQRVGQIVAALRQKGWLAAPNS